jgi:transposase
MFNASDCSPCLARALCTRSQRHRRKLTFRPQVEQTILDQTRAYQQTDEFQERYAVRAGIEGTISQAVVALTMRRSRYRGQLKTHLQHVATATAINLKRLSNWWNEIPMAHTQISRFHQLMAVS